jgi:hypothetical protein
LVAFPVFRADEVEPFQNRESDLLHAGIRKHLSLFCFCRRGKAKTNALPAASRSESAISPDAIARAVAEAIERPHDVDVKEIIVRPTAKV